MKVLGLDFETQGLPPKQWQITEVGALLVKVSAPRSFEKVQLLSELCFTPEHIKQTPTVIDLTGITDEMIQNEGRHTKLVLTELLPLIAQADIVMAHNAPFDRQILEINAKRYGIELPRIKWFCSRTDVPYASKYTCKKLSHLALDHGLKMDHRQLHRAINDIELMLELVLMNYDIEQLVKGASEPWIVVEALIPAPWTDGGRGKEAAKAAGFRFKELAEIPGRTFGTKWVKALKPAQLPEVSNLSFDVRQIQL